MKRCDPEQTIGKEKISVNIISSDDFSLEGGEEMQERKKEQKLLLIKWPPYSNSQTHETGSCCWLTMKSWHYYISYPPPPQKHPISDLYLLTVFCVFTVAQQLRRWESQDDKHIKPLHGKSVYI